MNTGRSGSGTYFSSLSLSRHTTHMLWHIAPFLALLTATEPPPPRQGKVVYGECPRHIFPSSSSSPPPEEKYASSSSSVSPPPGLRPKREKGEKDAATDGWRGVSGRGKQHGRKGEKAWPREKGPDVSIWGGRRGTSHCSGPHPLLSPTPNPFFHSGRWPRWKKRRGGRGEVSTPLFPHLFFRLVLSLFFEGKRGSGEKIPPSLLQPGKVCLMVSGSDRRSRSRSGEGRGGGGGRRGGEEGGGQPRFRRKHSKWRGEGGK